MDKNNEIEKPPVFDSWSGWYRLLIIVLAIITILFVLFSKAFS